MPPEDATSEPPLDTTSFDSVLSFVAYWNGQVDHYRTTVDQFEIALTNPEFYNDYLLSIERGDDPFTVLTRKAANAERQVKQGVQAAQANYPSLYLSSPFLTGLSDLDDINKVEKRIKDSLAAGSRPQPLVFRGDGGEIIFLDPFSGVEVARRVFPELAARPQYQIVTDRDGNLVAVDPQRPGFQPVTLIEGFSFPEIDPREQFAFEQEIASARLDLDQRSLEIQAYGLDGAHQIELGRMTFEEVALNLRRIGEAMTQRRAEREQLLQFAVTERSLRAGGTETLLPGGEQLAAILSQATGQEFGPDFAQIPAGRIDPEAAGQEVLDASAFQSPIPGLTAGLQASRDAISAILGAPLASKITAQQAATMTAEKIQGA